ncbi:hypothetical protein [Shimia aestuarii]|uniref:hypothetical protein n=1 Tax=Shimia aestuarii TaxID=254406 RepID=UPI0013F4E05E|nr:hypothetical protein [Shimia aestuarii]
MRIAFKAQAFVSIAPQTVAPSIAATVAMGVSLAIAKTTTDPDSGKAPHGIEIYTSFVTHGAYYCYPCIPGWLTGREIKPFGTAMLRGIEFAVPRQSEAWLASHYGDGWSALVKPSEFRKNPARYAFFEFPRTEDT